MPQKPGAQKYFEDYANEFVSSYEPKGIKALIWKDLHEREAMSIRLCMPVEGKRILDVGCGDGRYGLELARLGVGRYLGIDFSEVMIEKAKSSARDLPALEFRQTGFMEFAGTETFDHVIAMGVMDYIKEPVEFITKALSLAGKSVLLSFPQFTMIRGTARIARYKMRGCPIWLYSSKEISQLLNSIPEAASYRVYPISGYGMDFVVEIFPRPR